MTKRSRDFKSKRHTRSLPRRVLREIARPFEKAARFIARVAAQPSKSRQGPISEKARFAYRLLRAERRRLNVSAID